MNRPDRIRGNGEPQPLELVLERPELGSTNFTSVWQRLVDGLSEQIALLDEDWTILAVNQSWTKAAALYGRSAFVPGANYLQSCRELACEGLQIAIDVVKGIEEIDAGKHRSLRIFYHSSQPETGLDHELRINRFKAGGRTFASVTRYDVTGKVELRELRKDFSRSVIQSQAEERRRIGREIHDSTMQLIGCLELKMTELERCCPDDGFETKLDEMRELVGETRQAIRAISFLTHPPQLDHHTLPEALDELVNGFGRRTGLYVTFETEGEEWDETDTIYPVIGEAAYRIVQEALSNAHRHAQATRAVVRLVRRKLYVHVIVADDGIGMPKFVSSGVGLASMHSRLAELGGRLTIQSGRPGTTIIASIPAPVVQKQRESA